jgi:hypothetical protein
MPRGTCYRGDAVKYIGGFFELELPRARGGWHPNAIALSTGRACIAGILQHVRPRTVHMPFYTCDALIAPVLEAGIGLEFYHLDKQLRPARLRSPKRGELLIAINYFGLQTAVIRKFAERFGDRLVADNTQAFFERPASGHWAFCSARKFFGVPDGAYLYAAKRMDLHPPPNPASNIRHLVSRLVGRQQTGYRQVRRFEQKTDGRIRQMSVLSKRLLSAIDYAEVRRRRRENYLFLDRKFARYNLFDSTLPVDATPFCYPLLLDRSVDRGLLARHRLYVPTLWEDVFRRRGSDFAWERKFAMQLLPLPIDHRYRVEDMEGALQRFQKVVKL